MFANGIENDTVGTKWLIESKIAIQQKALKDVTARMIITLGIRRVTIVEGYRASMVGELRIF